MRNACATLLRGAGYTVVEARNGQAALDLIGRERPDLVLLDVDMPVLNGWKTLERLAQQHGRPPVIMLTGAIQVDERVRGLQAGVDDYLCKPCDHRELLARIQLCLRRSQPGEIARKVLRFGSTTIDLANRTAARDGKPVGLTRTEYALLEIFARHPDQLVTREQMLEEIWGYKVQTNTRTLDTHIYRLRLKLQDQTGAPRWIQSVAAGDGYRMVCDALPA